MERILVICERGNVRSVTCAAILKDYLGLKDVIAAGAQTTTPETLRQLTQWANLILVVGTPTIRAALPNAAQAHVIVLDIGEDRWGQAMHPDLVRAIAAALLRDTGLFHTGSPSPYWHDLAQYMNAAEQVFRRAQEASCPSD